jgi:hypothetical protein
MTLEPGITITMANQTLGVQELTGTITGAFLCYADATSGGGYLPQSARCSDCWQYLGDKECRIFSARYSEYLYNEMKKSEQKC